MPGQSLRVEPLKFAFCRSVHCTDRPDRDNGQYLAADRKRGEGFDAPQTSQVELSLMGSSHRSEEHTSELQSLMRISYAVFCLKKKIKKTRTKQNTANIKKNHNNKEE